MSLGGIFRKIIGPGSPHEESEDDNPEAETAPRPIPQSQLNLQPSPPRDDPAVRNSTQNREIPEPDEESKNMEPPPLIRPNVRDPLIGRSIMDRYRIVEEIAVGGMGVVYKAYQSAMSRTVAIKMLPPEKISDETALERFKREARSASHLKHPNTVTIYDFGQTEDGSLFIVMEYLEGKFLDKLVKQEGAVPLMRTLHGLSGICGALTEAHRSGIIHRDIKPANLVFLSVPEEIIKVVDFGAARLKNSNLTEGAFILGTPMYMSPEQIRGKDIDARSDIFSLGLVAYELLSGKYPFGSRTFDIPTICHCLLDAVPAPFAKVCPELAIPAEVEAVVFKMLAKDPEQRYQTADEIRRKLDLLHLHQQLLHQQAINQIGEEIDEPVAAGKPSQRQAAEITTHDGPTSAIIQPQRRPAPKQAPPPKPPKQVKITAQRLKPAVPASRTAPPPFRDATGRMLAEIDRFIRTDQTPLALASLRAVLNKDPTNGRALKLAKRIYEQADRRLADDEQTWLERLVESMEAVSLSVPVDEPSDMAWVAQCTIASAYGGRVSTSGFWIDLTPVTNEQYAEFVRAKDVLPPDNWPGANPPQGLLDHPVVGISLARALKYAEFREKRLPTNVEWEIAARTPDGRRFPWGNEWNPSLCHCPEHRATGTASVNRYAGDSPGGCADLVGNVWEWTELDPQSRCPESRRFVFGGSYRHACEKDGYIAQTTVPVDSSSWVLGFRCVMDGEED